MDRTLVLNASPLILLARIDRLDLVASLAKVLVLPEAVIREIQEGSHRDEAAEKIKNLPSVLEVADLPIPERIRLWDLGAGESQVLAHSIERQGSEVVLDDLAARRCAQYALAQITAGHIFHYEKMITSVLDSPIQYSDYAWMVKLAHLSSPTKESIEPRSVFSELPVKDFHGYERLFLTIERFPDC